MRRTTYFSAYALVAGAACWFGAAGLRADAPGADAAGPPTLDLFDAMQKGAVEAKFIARDSHRGRIVLNNTSKQPVSVSIPDAFIGVPALGQFGGGGGGLGGGLGGGGGQQQVGGGGGFGGGRGGGRGGGGFGGRGGGRGGGFNVPPEDVVRIDVPLLCLDHGLREPSTNKPYLIRPIQNYISDPAVISIVASYASGELPPGAAQAAVWNLNSRVSWQELAEKLTGTERDPVRSPYFSADEIQTAMAIAHQAEADTAGDIVKPVPFALPGEKKSPVADEPFVSPGEEPAKSGKATTDAKAADDDGAKKALPEKRSPKTEKAKDGGARAPA